MPPHFTTLPREIRDAILEMCLVVGVIKPYSAWGYKDPFRRSTREPDISLLAVSKAINAEAAEIFYGKNVWFINWAFNDDQAPMDAIWYIHRNQIRHVSISLLPKLREVDLWSLAVSKAYQMPPKDMGSNSDLEALTTDLCRWNLNICRELGVKFLTVDLPLHCRSQSSPFAKVFWRCCLEPLLDWVRNDEEIRVGEPNPASVRSCPPQITMTSHPDIVRAVRQGWEEQWGPLNHYTNGDRDCLEGFFQPRDAKTIGKT